MLDILMERGMPKRIELLLSRQQEQLAPHERQAPFQYIWRQLLGSGGESRSLLLQSQDTLSSIDVMCRDADPETVNPPILAPCRPPHEVGCSMQ